MEVLCEIRGAAVVVEDTFVFVIALKNRCRIDSTGSKYMHMVSFCELDNQPSSSIKCIKSVD